eukprot:752821-Hanusia_phi.AAC.5
MSNNFTLRAKHALYVANWRENAEFLLLQHDTVRQERERVGAAGSSWQGKPTWGTKDGRGRNGITAEGEKTHRLENFVDLELGVQRFQPASRDEELLRQAVDVVTRSHPVGDADAEVGEGAGDVVRVGEVRRLARSQAVAALEDAEVEAAASGADGEVGLSDEAEGGGGVLEGWPPLDLELVHVGHPGDVEVARRGRVGVYRDVDEAQRALRALDEVVSVQVHRARAAAPCRPEIDVGTLGEPAAGLVVLRDAVGAGGVAAEEDHVGSDRDGQAAVDQRRRKSHRRSSIPPLHHRPRRPRCLGIPHVGIVGC